MDMPEPSAEILARKGSIVARLAAALGSGAVISDPVELRPSASTAH